MGLEKRLTSLELNTDQGMEMDAAGKPFWIAVDGQTDFFIGSKIHYKGKRPFKGIFEKGFKSNCYACLLYIIIAKSSTQDSQQLLKQTVVFLWHKHLLIN